MKTDKELADELDARDRLRARGYVWKSCKHCHGIKDRFCGACGGKGGRWESPMMRMADDMREVRKNQPRVTWAEAVAQAKRVKAAIGKSSNAEFRRGDVNPK